jgi:hypothetical protein
MSEGAVDSGISKEWDDVACDTFSDESLSAILSVK